jgi:hypothetical protein
LPITGIAKAVLLALLDHVNSRDFEKTGQAECWPSRETLAQETGFCSRAIFTALKLLEGERLISIFYQQSNTGEYRSNIYIVHLNIIAERRKVTQTNGPANFKNRRRLVHNPHAPDAQPPGTTRITPMHHVPTNLEGNPEAKFIIERTRSANETISTLQSPSSMDQASISAQGAEGKFLAQPDSDLDVPFLERCIEAGCRNKRTPRSKFCNRCSSK